MTPSLNFLGCLDKSLHRGGGKNPPPSLQCFTGPNKPSTVRVNIPV